MDRASETSLSGKVVRARGIRVPGYGPAVSVGGVRWPIFTVVRRRVGARTAPHRVYVELLG